MTFLDQQMLAQYNFTVVVLMIIAFAGVTGLFSYIFNRENREMFKSMINEWKKKGGSR